MNNAGIEILQYIPNGAYSAAIPEHIYLKKM